ncbi:pyocin activator PrtN family protein [Bradyrhizobium elkanii]|uniref:pyocin activator PrtN family protein n=1 Tax=Bradyrhizobium elkanii TaxID=29448 RepID=UPI00351125AE
MNTAFLLMAQYGGKAIIPIEDECRDYSSHLAPTKQKFSAGEIAMPVCPTHTPALLTLAFARFFLISRCTRRAHAGP